MAHRLPTNVKRGHRIRWWALSLGVVAALTITIWRVGPSGKHPSSAGAAAQSPRPMSTVAASPSLDVPVMPKVPLPKTAPEFTATFTGSQLNTSIWSTCYPGFGQSGCTNFGNRGHEDEWYLPSQVQVSGGLLHLIAHREPTSGATESGAPETYQCRSGMVTTYPGFNFEYGYIQVVARIPAGAGLWPALWLAASDLKWPPEMDIVEAWSTPRFPSLFASTYFHYKTSSGNAYVGGPITPATSAFGWHTFALSWTSTKMTWLVDGNVIMTVRQHVPHQKMYFIADLAESISKAHPHVTAGQCNGSLLIRSVKVWGP